MNRAFQALACILFFVPATASLAAQSLLSGGLTGTSTSSASTPDSAPDAAADSTEYANGIRAIHESRWADAIQVFSHIIDTRGANADAALYWKAYALNKSGNTQESAASCARLKQDFALSRWIEECEALEIEIKVRNGKTVVTADAQNDSTLLLSLNSMMNKNKKEALEQIDEILNSDAPGYLKKEAKFVLDSNHAQTVNAQIVRLRSIEGDVRIHRSATAKNNPTWETAVSGLPLYSGDSIVTVDGRAEIEFEDASMMYLDARSILLFNELATIDGSPRTDLSLLSGTASFHLLPTIADEIYNIHTPTDTASTRYPHPANFRLTSYADGIAAASLDPDSNKIANLAHEELAQASPNFYFRDGHYLNPPETEEKDRFAEWDSWVEKRYDERMKAMAEVEHDSGLKTDLPGLDQLAGRGEFFSCVSHGICWQPTIEPDPAQNPNLKIKSTAKQPINAQDALNFSGYFPCVYPYAYQWQMLDFSAAASTDVYDAYTRVEPWYWTVCHTGNWIYSHRRRHYVWVPGRTRHHTPPVHWIRSGKTVAFVPKHPKDYASALPLNRHEEVFVVKGKVLGPTQLDPHEPVTTLNRPTRDVGEIAQAHLKAAAEPVMAMRNMKDSITTALLKSSQGSIPVKFDARHGAFLAPSTERSFAGKPAFAPINNHAGNLQPGGHGSSGGFSGSRGGSAYSGSHSGGNSSASSGTHGGASSSAPTSSGAASSSSSSSAGGGHH